MLKAALCRFRRLPTRHVLPFVDLHYYFICINNNWNKYLLQVFMASSPVLFVMGNGPSPKNNVRSSRCVKSAPHVRPQRCYRAYKQFDFYPTYFGCFDFVVNESHRRHLRRSSRVRTRYTNSFIGDQAQPAALRQIHGSASQIPRIQV